MKRWLVWLSFALLVGAPSAVRAQIATGNIYGTVVDQQGGALPGVNVSLVSARIGVLETPVPSGAAAMNQPDVTICCVKYA